MSALSAASTFPRSQRPMCRLEKYRQRPAMQVVMSFSHRAGTVGRRQEVLSASIREFRFAASVASQREASLLRNTPCGEPDAGVDACVVASVDVGAEN